MNDIEVIKVELTEENLIKLAKIEFENGSCITIPNDTSGEVYRSNERIIFRD